MKRGILTIVAVLWASGSAHAVLSAREIKMLGTTLTPWGAIKVGNKEGTIPAYEGGLPTSTSPPGFEKNSGHWVDPYADEKPLYSITAKNMARYADKLSEATKELLRRFPETYRVDVYQTHRTVNYPSRYIAATLKNAERCHTIDNGEGLKGCLGGMAFPIPKTGNEIMWNIQTGFRLPYHEVHQGVRVDAIGIPKIAVQEVRGQYPYSDPKQTLESFERAGAWHIRTYVQHSYPARVAGDSTTLWFSINPNANPNRGWSYQRHNGRMRSIPDVEYDYPVIASGGAMIYDEANLFRGKVDRFEWKLLGKKEMLIPYNAYRYLFDSSKEDIVAVGEGRHPNPDLNRWELHRVYVVEGTLKSGARHAYAKRRYYVDEDHPLYGMADSWDHAGNIYKGYFSQVAWAYDYQAPIPNAGYLYDFLSGVSYHLMITKETSGVFFNETISDSQFDPKAMQK